MNQKIKLALAAIVGVAICGVIPGVVTYTIFPPGNLDCLLVPLIVGGFAGAWMGTTLIGQEKPLRMVGTYLGHAAVGAIVLTIPAVVVTIINVSSGCGGTGFCGAEFIILAIPGGAFIGLIVCSVRLSNRKSNS